MSRKNSLHDVHCPEGIKEREARKPPATGVQLRLPVTEDLSWVCKQAAMWGQERTLNVT